VGPDGDAVWLEEARGIPIGVVDQPSYATVEAQLPPGATLVLYTDGLVEERGVALDVGLGRLADAVVHGPPELDPLCDHVLDRVLADPAIDDDVTMLVLRTVPSHQARIELEVRGDPGALRAFRATTRRWIASASSDRDEVDDVTMAVNEAVQNAIEHGHRRRRTPVAVVLQRDGADLALTVRDSGRWMDNSPGDRGRGLELMRALVDDVDVSTARGGTTVVLRRRLRAPSDGSAQPVAAHEPHPTA
jgi:anti-sigma regulatory factor (Ser/Thr protein kinase)